MVVVTKSMKDILSLAREGKNILIVGPEGVGKSTTLLYSFNELRKESGSLCILLSARKLNQQPQREWIIYMKSSLQQGR